MESFELFLQKIATPLPSWAIYGQLENELIDEAESALSIKFPPSYRLFLKNYGAMLVNGHEILGLAQAPEDKNQTPMFENLVSYTLSRRTDKHYPSHLIPICHDGMSSEFCLNASKTNQDRENPIEVFGPGTEGIVAKNFKEFLILLVEDRIEY